MHRKSAMKCEATDFLTVRPRTGHRTHKDIDQLGVT